MVDKRELKFVRALIAGATAKKTSSGLFRIEKKSVSISLASRAVAALASKGVLVLHGESCLASDVAHSWLKRQLVDNLGFADQHRQIKKTSEGVAVNLKEGPLAALATEKNGNPPFLCPHHLVAAGRVQALALRAQMLQRITMSYDPTRIGGKNSGGSVAADLGVSAIDARKTLSAALSRLPPDCAGVVMDVCGFQKGLQLIEIERRWPRRSAKLILRLGLEQLAKQSGLGIVATGAISNGNNSWIQPDARLINPE